jgi:hypothetical protein
VEAPTRIIPIQQPAQPASIPRAESDPGLIRMNVAGGRESVSGGEPEGAQRFAGEVKFVTYYAQKLADILGMRSLVLGIVEDREGQTSFRSSPSGWHGSVSSNKRSLRQVRESLMKA